MATVNPTSVSSKRSEPTPTRTPLPTATSTATPTPTQTPTPSPTPTPTTQPISVIGNPRFAALNGNPAKDETECGLVDVLDFPLNPPDGDGIARGGDDFGVYRRRYEQYHTGEDWWTSRGQSSFGTPVYSIGHGRVTYAAPLGWGRDQGIVIIRHTFDDGRQLLSFYGHLDPPSVNLSVGQCIERGQQVGKIGRPRTPPHLHFEIRTHMPDEPGGGYWWQDPTLAGWLPPSETIWRERMAGSPGVGWLRAPEGIVSLAIGPQAKDTFLIFENEQIIGLNTDTGEPRWSFTSELRIQAAALDANKPILYVADQAGRVEAIHLPDSATFDTSVETAEMLETLWQVDLETVGIPELVPLPRGGVMLAAWKDVHGVSDEGRILWQYDTFDRVLDWDTIGDRLLLSTIRRDHSMWTVDEEGIWPWTDLSGGALAAQQDHGLLFNNDGLFRLNPVEGSRILLSQWPSGGWRDSDVLGLEDGGALVTYLSSNDRRLIRFDAEGAVIWHRSIPADVLGTPSLVGVAGKPFLSAESQSGNARTVSIYAIDSEKAILTLLFEGGTRTSRSMMNSIYPSDSGMLYLNIGGGHLVNLDLSAAADRIANSPSSLPQ